MKPENAPEHAQKPTIKCRATLHASTLQQSIRTTQRTHTNKQCKCEQNIGTKMHQSTCANQEKNAERDEAAFDQDLGATNLLRPRSCRNHQTIIPPSYCILYTFLNKNSFLGIIILTL